MGNKPLNKLQQNELNDFCQLTTFSPDEICIKKTNSYKNKRCFFVLAEEWHRYFHKNCPTGQLTADEFKKIYAQFFPAGDSSTFAMFFDVLIQIMTREFHFENFLLH
jgi:hypothetical protein